MEDFNDTLTDFDGQLKQTQYLLYKDNKYVDAIGTAIRKLDGYYTQLKSQLVQLKGVHKYQGYTKLKQREQQYNEVKRQAQGIQVASRPVALSNDPMTATYYKQKMANAYINDAQRNASEAQETGNAIIESLQSYNQQMDTIINTNLRIYQNTDKSHETLKLMEKKERAVNITLYCIVALLIASDAVAFWVFHHNTSPSE